MGYTKENYGKTREKFELNNKLRIIEPIHYQNFFMFFDTHSHCYFPDLAAKEAEVFANMVAFGVTHNTQIGANIISSKECVALAKKYPNTYATVGIHPTDAQDFDEASLAKCFDTLDLLIEENRENIVAIGETGFDFFHLEAGKEDIQKATQELFFEMQVELAKKHNLPLIIHTRVANDTTLAALKIHGVTHAVMHCFSEDLEFAKKCRELSSDIYFSFSGTLTYKKSDAIREVAAELPLDRIMIETDSPFLAPQVVRGTVNEPANVRYVFEELVKLRSEPKEVMEKMIFENSLRFFGLKK